MTSVCDLRAADRAILVCWTKRANCPRSAPSSGMSWNSSRPGHRGSRQDRVTLHVPNSLRSPRGTDVGRQVSMEDHTISLGQPHIWTHRWTLKIYQATSFRAENTLWDLVTRNPSAEHAPWSSGDRKSPSFDAWARKAAFTSLRSRGRHGYQAHVWEKVTTRNDRNVEILLRQVPQHVEVNEPDKCATLTDECPSSFGGSADPEDHDERGG